MFSLAFKLFDKILPYNDFSDNIIHFLRFLFKHKRFPKKREYFNDYLYNIKSSNEILNPIRQFVSDKYLVKDYIRSKVGDQYNVPTIAIFESYQDLKNFEIPQNCCIKPTQASGKVILRKNGEKINIEETKEWFELNYYKSSRERNYKYLKPKVIIEPLIFNMTDLMDYRIFCFNGKAKLICIDIGKYSGYQRIFYDTNWKKQDFSLNYPLYDGEVEKPDNLDEMIRVAEKLSAELNLVRIDMYSDGTSCLVGEITNCHAGATQKFIPVTAEKKASEIIFGKN